METSLQPTYKSLLQKCNRSKNLLLVDWISGLPNEVLAIILSLLTMKEAARTSILSQRWKNLWKLITNRLDFDDWNVLQETNISRERELLGLQRSKYINWVNQILDSHKCGSIDMFRVHFDLDLTSKSDINRWINFAIEKRVKRLDLDLEQMARDTMDHYPFPVQILGNQNISFLTSLSLNNVDVTQEVLNSFFSDCPVLEFFRMSNSKSLVHRVLFCSEPKLKHLEIIRCPNIRCIMISAVNLRSLIYVGPIVTICFGDTPNLTDVSFGGYHCYNVIHFFDELPPASKFLSKLQVLTLDIDKEMYGIFPKFPIFANLKQLELILVAWDLHGLLGCTSMITACPVLYRFKLQFNWLDDLSTERKVRKEKCLLPKSLKVVELRKFRGGTTDVEMATFLFENAQFLEKICLDTRNPDLVDQHKKLAAKECARQLATRLYPTAELIVL